MRTENLMRTVLALVFLLSAGLALLPGAAAQALQPGPTYRGGGYYEDNTTSKHPRHGYSGWSPGNRYYCDYQRHPVRKCNERGRCKVVAWELKQYCY